MSEPRFLYLHGFGSGPGSVKGTFLARHFAQRGVQLELLNLRLPSMERLSLGAGMAHARARIGDARDRAIAIGSSLGGLTAARVAEEDARVCALILLAPAFQIFKRWRKRMGEAA